MPQAQIARNNFFVITISAKGHRKKPSLFYSKRLTLQKHFGLTRVFLTANNLFTGNTLLR